MDKHRLRNGLEVFHLNRAETDFLYDEVFVSGSYLSHGISLASNDVVFDVGANIGIASLFFHERSGPLRIHAFEPDPNVFAVLEANMVLNDCNAKVYNIALGKSAGRAQFTIYPNNTVMSGLFADAEDDSNTTTTFMVNSGIPANDARDIIEVTGKFEHQRIDCEIRTVSEIIEEQGIERIDLLKVDVEKAEMDVLTGIREGHWPLVRQAVVEVHDIQNRLRDVQGLLRAQGFEVVTEQDPLFENTPLYTIFALRS